MLECEPTPLQTLEQKRHIERRTVIASHAVRDVPMALKHPSGITGYQAEAKRLEAIARAKEAMWEALAKVHEIEESFPDVDFLLPECSRVDKWPTWFINKVKKVVATEFSVSINDIDAGRRLKEHVTPRFVAIYLSKILTIKSLPDLGRRFGDRDHTTILHAIRQIEKRMKTDSYLCQQVVELHYRLERDLAAWREMC